MSEKLKWANWYRTEGCRHWMDKTKFAGVSFTNVMYEGMRSVFLDEKGNPGMLYTGEVYEQSKQIVAENGRRYGFDEGDQIKYLRKGLFKFDDNSDSILSPILDLFQGRLRFQGPDKEDLEKTKYAEADVGGDQVDVHFYNIISDAVNGQGSFSYKGALPQNANGVTQLAYFTAAVILHEIIHSHGFTHPVTPDSTPGSDYASSLPHVAMLSVLRAAHARLGTSNLPISASAGPKWHDWENLGGQVKGDIGAVCVPGTNVTDLYVTGMDDTLWQKYWDNGWSNWIQVDPTFEIHSSSSPVAVSANPSHRGIFARNRKNMMVYHKKYDGQWHPWENLGGTLKGKMGVGDAGAVSIQEGVTDVYVTGLDDMLWQKYYANGTWSDWFQVDSTMKLASSPVAVSANPSHRAVYARGKDGAVYHKYWDGVWHPWENLGGNIKGDIAAVAVPGSNVTDLYVRGMDDTLWQKYWDNGWSDWQQVDPGFKLASSPVAVSAGISHRAIYAKGTDGSVYHKFWG